MMMTAAEAEKKSEKIAPEVTKILVTLTYEQRTVIRDYLLARLGLAEKRAVIKDDDLSIRRSQGAAREIENLLEVVGEAMPTATPTQRRPQGLSRGATV